MVNRKMILLLDYDSPATRRVLSSRTKNSVSSEEIQPSSSMENKMLKEFDRVVEKDRILLVLTQNKNIHKVPLKK